jgi:hypothetical protein
MFTDAPPRKANRAGFNESDRIRTLDLPRDGHLQEIAQRLESAMKTDNIRDVRSVGTEFLASASISYEVPTCGVRVLAARPLRTREHGTFELFGDYSRPLSPSDISAANRRHDETLAHSPWFRLWQRYGVCCRTESQVLRVGETEN